MQIGKDSGLKIESIDSDIMNDSMPVSMNYFEKDEI